jgi:hypothetical protein
MPYRQTRQEAIARIAMRALLDAKTRLTQRQVAALFHASTRTVNDANKHTVTGWGTVLMATRDMPQPSSFTAHWSRVARPVEKHYLVNPSAPLGRAPRPGDRKSTKLKLVQPDDKRTDANVEPSDEGLEDDPNRVLPDPHDDPQPIPPRLLKARRHKS